MHVKIYNKVGILEGKKIHKILSSKIPNGPVKDWPSMIDGKAEQRWDRENVSYGRAEHFLCPVIEHTIQSIWGEGSVGSESGSRAL